MKTLTRLALVALAVSFAAQARLTLGGRVIYQGHWFKPETSPTACRCGD
jgi:hypothetical protein